jgi:hypothetical protein
MAVPIESPEKEKAEFVDPAFVEKGEENVSTF